MPDAVNMPELNELPPADRQDSKSRRSPLGWFVRGFVAAALLFGAFVAAQTYLASSQATDQGPQTIIVGK